VNSFGVLISMIIFNLLILLNIILTTRLSESYQPSI
jgi:hypothetical protein